MLPILILYLEKEEKNNRSIILTHTVAVAIFLVTIYSYPTLSIRKYLPMVIVPVAFLFVTEERYEFTLRAIRYWVCYIFASAAIWKIVRGAAFDKEHMIETVISQHIDTIVHWSDHYMSGIASWLIAHPMACAALLIAAVLSQLTFLIGFFTRNYDKWLMALLGIFVLADYLVMRIEYWEYALLLPLLYIPTSKQKQ